MFEVGVVDLWWGQMTLPGTTRGELFCLQESVSTSQARRGGGGAGEKRSEEERRGEERRGEERRKEDEMEESDEKEEKRKHLKLKVGGKAESQQRLGERRQATRSTTKPPSPAIFTL